MQLEKDLLASELRFRRFRQHFTDGSGMLLLDAETEKIINVNPFLEKLLGYSKSELLGKKLRETEPFKNIKTRKLSFKKLQDKKYIHYKNFPLQTKNGEHRNVEFVSYIFLVGNKQRIRCNIRDVTKHKGKENTFLRGSEEVLRCIFNNSNDGIIASDVTTKKILFGNRTICRMLGYTYEELEFSTLRIKDIHPQKDLPAVMEAFDKLMRKEIKIAPNIPVQRKDGSVFYVDISLFPIKVENNAACLASIFRDTTERKQAEEEKHSLQEQLIRSEKLAAVGELIAGVVHEINNPLTGMVGLSELLLRENKENFNKETKICLQSIHKSSKRIQGIVVNLQRFAHRERKSSKKNVNINELIDVVLSIRDYEMTARNIKIKKHYQPDLPLVFADPSQLEQVFLNLITNAEYAIHGNQEKAGTLTVATSVVPDNAGGTVVVEFSDTGPGIPIDVLPKLFNPFFTTKPVGKGTGLGLSVSHSIIKEHGGEISAGNRKESGAVFTIELPIRGGG